MDFARKLLTRALALLAGMLPGSAARWSRQFALGVVVGILGGSSAYVLYQSLHVGSAWIIGRVAPHSGQFGILDFHVGVLLLPALGGLLSGLAIYYFCPNAIGHGTDALTRAFHRDMGAMPLQPSVVKGVAAVGVISCGGSAGPEGPIAALGAAIGSSIGRVFRVTPHERRIMLVAGCAAGVGAIFQCPLGGALFAAGVLYRDPEFETDAIVPAVIASVVSYSTFMMFSSPEALEPLLPNAHDLRFKSIVELLPYALLGPLCGLMCMCFSLSMRLVDRTLVRLMLLPIWALPALGGLVTGAIACLVPQVMDGQYGFIRLIMSDGTFTSLNVDPWWWVKLFAAVAVAKCIATAFTVGSGGSGGVLGPSVFIGGATGAFLGAFCEALFPDVFPEDLREALIPVGMGGVLAAAMRTPLAAIVMVTEMTDSYGLIVPSMLVCISSYVTGRRFGLNHEQVRTAAESPAHAADGVVHTLERLHVADLMDTDREVTADVAEPLKSLVARMKPGTRPVFAVLEKGHVAGLISVPDVRRIMDEPELLESLIASDLMTDRVSTVLPDQSVYDALNVFSLQNHDVLPVVSAGRRRTWVGMLSRRAVFEALRREAARMQESVVREHAGLMAIDREGQLNQLMMAVAPTRADQVQRLLVPLEAVGLSLRQADVRNRFEIEVLAIEQPDGSVQCPPDPNAPLRTDQRLIAIVWDRPADLDRTEEPAPAATH
ncbi:MAG: CBS domain-containing protein [Phycisphaerales bacterium]|nr:MAG: CBS domain-containing protein [Phycisphaerales bacterium]